MEAAREWESSFAEVSTFVRPRLVDGKTRTSRPAIHLASDRGLGRVHLAALFAGSPRPEAAVLRDYMWMRRRAFFFGFTFLGFDFPVSRSSTRYGFVGTTSGRPSASM